MPLFDTLSDFETIGWDYATTGHSLRGHPLEPLRDELSRLGLPDGRTVRRMRDGQRVRYAGLVICHQRPGHRRRCHVHDARGRDAVRERGPLEGMFEKNRIIAKTRRFWG